MVLQLPSHLTAVTTGLLLFVFPGYLAAQVTMEALSTPPAVPTFSYAPSGVGWSFVPATNLLVTAVYSTAPEVTFWKGTNLVIATYFYPGPYFDGVDAGPPTNFQTVSPLYLSSGQTYFVSTQYSNFFDSVNIFIFELNGADGFSVFSTSPYISQFASYYLSPEGQWSSTTTPPSDNINYLLLGPNFQFQVDSESAPPWVNMDFEQSTIVSSSPSGYGFNIGTANVPGWTEYNGWGDNNYSGGATVIYNDQTLDSPEVALEGTNYWTPAIQGNYSVLLWSGSIFLQEETNGAAIGHTGQIPFSAQSITYWGESENSLQITFNGQMLSFIAITNTANYTIFGADISGIRWMFGRGCSSLRLGRAEAVW